MSVFGVTINSLKKEKAVTRHEMLHGQRGSGEAKLAPHIRKGLLNMNNGNHN